jgi:mRNA interferase RelE/StbE
MRYEVGFLPEAQRQIERLSPDISHRILAKIERMRNDLAGDIKRLSNIVPAYRLRVGDWRILFEIAGTTIVIHQVLHRSKAYD